MNIFTRIDKAIGRFVLRLEEGKEFNADHKSKGAFNKSRTGITTDFLCECCSHTKAFYKGSTTKCCKCGARYKR